MANQFSIEPGQNYGPGLSGLAQTVGRVGEKVEKRKTLQRATEKFAKMKADAITAYRSGDPDKMATFSLKNPEMAQAMRETVKFKNEITEENYKDSLIEFYVNPDAENATRLTEDRQRVLQEQGVGPESSVETDTFFEKFTQDPEKMRSEIGMTISGMYPKAWEAMKAADPTKGLETGYKTYLKAYELKNSAKNYEDYQANKVKQKKLMEKEAPKRPFMSKLMAEGYVPATRITGPQLDAYEAAAAKASEMGKPFTVQDIYDMEFRAQKNRATGQTSGSRLVLARKQNIEAANGLLEDMKVTSEKLDYSPVQFIGALEKFKKGQLGDPIFTEYMTQRADSLFILGNALKQNGLTDKSIEVEEEAFSPTLSPPQFNAWYNVQLRALNRAAEEMNRDYKYGLTTSPTFPAGQAGAPTKENPVPTMPEEKNVKEMTMEELTKRAFGGD